ncbi:MAG TPA: NADH:flavin oxidoreductase [Microbacterium sp.]|nr:NADH:flavin oxidoreductase [Microbacterium sp.]
MTDVLFEPLSFRNLTVKNRLFRSSIGARTDHYDGTGTELRMRWDVKYARSGVGTIISSNSPVDPKGILVPGFATIERDERIPFWRELIRRVHEHDCKYIVQLAYAGRHREIPAIQYERGLSSTGRTDWWRGFEAERMTTAQMREIMEAFGRAGHRARDAGADGIEIAGANGFLLTQFLSPSINDRTDEYGGSLANRARFAIELVRTIRKHVGDDFHLQVKISLVDHVREVHPWRRHDGSTLEESIQVCQWLEEAGMDGFNVSTGVTFPHPRMPPGQLPMDVFGRAFAVASGGMHPLRDFLAFNTPLKHLVRRWWEGPARGREEGITLGDARALKRAVGVPVMCVGGFQTASVIRKAIESGSVDAVAIGRPLIANPDLPKLFAAGHDRPPNPCTYCNKCLVAVVESPPGCYEESRFASREAMIREIMALYEPPIVPAGSPQEP